MAAQETQPEILLRQWLRTSDGWMGRELSCGMHAASCASPTHAHLT